MRNYKYFILMLVLSFLVILTTNPVITYAASSSSNNGGIPFVLYLPLGIFAAAILAGIVNVVEKIRHKN